MLERDLQDYLFENPEVLFPNQTVGQRRREVFIEGRRIDLLFEVDGIQYIIELKRDTIKREDIGQVFEYYGLMRRSKPAASFRMVLVAPSIPDYRRIPLEEMGIRCVEVQRLPESAQERAKLRKTSAKQLKGTRIELSQKVSTLNIEQLMFEDLLPPVNVRSMQISHKLLTDALPSVQNSYSEYEIRPIKMVKPNQPDVLCVPETDLDSDYKLIGAGAWWAYSFGHSDQMPKNDVPNISVWALSWGLDFAINAELRTSQKVMQDRIAAAPKRFDHLVAEHGNLRAQAWLKFEFQPRLYYWVLLPQLPAGTWTGQDILDLYRQSETDFGKLRMKWVAWIKQHSGKLTAAQTSHLDGKSRNLNLALRLVYSFEKNNEVWGLPYREQELRFESEYLKLKPLIEFFQ
jgi:hypothetical protein